MLSTFHRLYRDYRVGVVPFPRSMDFPVPTASSAPKAAKGIEPRCCSADIRPGLPGNVFFAQRYGGGGDKRVRTFDLCLIRATLYQLSYVTMAGEEERLTSFISTRKCAYHTPRSCVSVLSFLRITGFGMCVGRRLPWWQFLLPRYCQAPGVAS